MAKVLVIDDDPDNRLVLKTRLAKSGHEVREAADGEEGLLAVQKDPPDLVFLDIAMPKLNGWDVCRSLKGCPETRSIPIIVVTAHDCDIGKTCRGRELPPDAFFSKPWDPLELQKTTEQLLAAGHQWLD